MRVKMLLNNILESLMDLHYHKFYSLSFQEYSVRRHHIEHKRRSSIANQAEMKIKRMTEFSLDSSPPYHILQAIKYLKVGSDWGTLRPAAYMMPLRDRRSTNDQLVWGSKRHCQPPWRDRSVEEVLHTSVV